MNYVEKQETFGWLVTVDLFLAGAGAGVFFISFISNLINRLESFSQIGLIVGPILVLIGALLLFVDLRNKKRFYRLITNPSSWMARGTWSIALFIVFSLAYSLPVISNPDAVTSMPLLFIGIIALISAITVMLYTGILFNEAKRVPFWNNPVLPVMFLFSSLYTGMAIFLIVAATSTGALYEHMRAVVIAELVLILVHLFALGLLLILAHHAAGAADQSARLLIRSGSFITTAVLAGMIVPLGLLLYQLFIMNTFLPTLIASVLLLVGGIFFRQGILRSGIRLSIGHTELLR